MQRKMQVSTTHNYALYHMIGQMHDMGTYHFSTQDLASLMGVSKPTAIARLNRMRMFGHLQRETVKHRSNAIAYRWSLTTKGKKWYQAGRFYDAYNAWKNEAYGSSKTNGSHNE